MESKLDSKKYNFEEYFLGSENHKFPKYAGYWVGYNLVNNYIQRTGISESEAVGLDAECFFDKIV